MQLILTSVICFNVGPLLWPLPFTRGHWSGLPFLGRDNQWVAMFGLSLFHTAQPFVFRYISCTMASKLYTDQDIIKAVAENYSVRKVLEALGLIPAGGSYKLFYTNVKRLNLDISHFTGQAHLKGKPGFNQPKQELSTILVEESTYTSTYKLKGRLIKAGLIEEKCQKCKILYWEGEKLSLHLDHIDGCNTNNTIENLRLPCPNCHSLTPTYCGKNKGKYKK